MVAWTLEMTIYYAYEMEFCDKMHMALVDLVKKICHLEVGDSVY